MFEIGLAELLVIGLIALLVLGPERLPRAARMAGLYLRKVRATWYSIRADIERELAAEDLQRALEKTGGELGADGLKQTLDETRRELTDAAASLLAPDQAAVQRDLPGAAGEAPAESGADDGGPAA